VDAPGSLGAGGRHRPGTIARILGAILIGLSLTIFTAAELGETRNTAKANATPSKA
jgi:hypothetical protein